jgi:hypothetical protein
MYAYIDQLVDNSNKYMDTLSQPLSNMQTNFRPSYKSNYDNIDIVNSVREIIISTYIDTQKSFSSISKLLLNSDDKYASIDKYTNLIYFIENFVSIDDQSDEMQNSITDLYSLIVNRDFKRVDTFLGYLTKKQTKDMSEAQILTILSVTADYRSELYNWDTLYKDAYTIIPSQDHAELLDKLVQDDLLFDSSKDEEHMIIDMYLDDEEQLLKILMQDDC